MIFNDIIGGIEVTWDQMVSEFLYWSQTGWEVGSIILLNPSAQQLKIDNFSTVATLEQLTTAFQHAIAPASAVGFSIDQTRKYTVAMVQAAGAMGLSLDMMTEEFPFDLNQLFTLTYSFDVLK
jgi:hypothetical protein